MSDHQYSLALTITYIPYIIVEIPASLILKRVGANTLLPNMAVLWGLTTTLQGLVGSYQGLLVARFFLGLFEGGLLPGIMLVMSRFYRRDQIQMRMTLLFTAASLAGAFSGLLASGILGMEGRAGHRGWQWIFILVRTCLHGFPIATTGRGLMNFAFVGGDFYCGIWTCDLLYSATDSNIIPISHWKREGSYLHRLWKPDLEEEAFSWKQGTVSLRSQPPT